MKSQRGEVTLFYIVIMFMINVWYIDHKSNVDSLGCKVDSPDVKCEVYRKNK